MNLSYSHRLPSFNSSILSSSTCTSSTNHFLASPLHLSSSIPSFSSNVTSLTLSSFTHTSSTNRFSASPLHLSSSIPSLSSTVTSLNLTSSTHTSSTNRFSAPLRLSATATLTSSSSQASNPRNSGKTDRKRLNSVEEDYMITKGKIMKLEADQKMILRDREIRKTEKEIEKMNMEMEMLQQQTEYYKVKIAIMRKNNPDIN